MVGRAAISFDILAANRYLTFEQMASLGFVYIRFGNSSTHVNYYQPGRNSNSEIAALPFRHFLRNILCRSALVADVTVWSCQARSTAFACRCRRT